MVNRPYIIVQARMGSERLPGKVMRQVHGRPLIGILLERLNNSSVPTILATSIKEENDELAEYVMKAGFKVFRGSENNLLERYFYAAKSVDGDLIIRLTGDNPFIDHDLIEEVVKKYKATDNDRVYISTALHHTYPIGICVEAFSFKLLEEAFLNATLPGEIEHVTPYMHQNVPGNIDLVGFDSDLSRPNYRLTIDTPEDFELARILIEEHNCASKSLREIISILDGNPELAKMNKDVVQRGWD